MKNSSNSSYSSSKSSSKNSSPTNTLRPTGTMLSLTEVLAEAQKLEKIQGVEVLLEDIQYLDLLCRKAEDYEEFPALLFRFFYVHDKTHYLLRWALEKDINTLSPNELFRGETMATRLFYYQFFGDLGRRFVTSILSNMIEEFALLEHSVEIELSRITVPMTASIDIDANLKWILEKLNKFIGTLVEAADNCPLGLRESFLFLKDVVGNKVENSNVFIASVLFLRLICPCLVSPEEYGIMHNLSVRKLTPHGKRGLIIASKILQSAANNYMWEERPGSQMVNQFITDSNPLIVEFASKLTDIDTISLGKKMVKASMTPISKEEVSLCHQNLKQFINIHILKKRVQSEVDLEQKINMATTMYQSKQWKTCHQAKKENCEYSISQLKQEGSNLVAFRYAAKFKTKFELVREYIKTNPEMAASVDERVQLNQVIERHSETHFDTYWLLKAQFPVSARDLVYTSRQFDETPDRWTQVTYSIDREDKPPTKCIRAIINLMYYLVERDPTDPESTLYTYIFHMDLKGWIPAMLINNNTKMSFNTLTKIAKNVMSIGKPQEEVVDKKKKKKKEDKAILKEKSGN